MYKMIMYVFRIYFYEKNVYYKYIINPEAL